MALVVLGFLAFVLVTLFWVAWVAMWLVVALFWLAWPITLLILAALAWRAQSRWYGAQIPRQARGEQKAPVQHSGNRAFDEYRDETLSRLDEERHQFGAFLERLRKSKDREAFDSYMAQRRRRSEVGASGLIASPQQ